MKRRQLLRSAIGVLPFAAAACSRPFTEAQRVGKKAGINAGARLQQGAVPKLLKPLRLQTGDLVSLIAPSGPVNEERLELAVNNLESKGFRVDVGKHILAQHGHNAGTDEQRLHDLHAAFAQPESKAVWCIRGGDGAYRLLPKIDYDFVANNPKLLIGYSDITALLQAFYVQLGLVGIHGPIGASSAVDFINFWPDLSAIVLEGGKGYTIKGNEQTSSLREGVAEGTLVGGNLSLLAALAGTPYAMDAKDKLVFIEDVGEEPRRVDRMLTTLRQACRLEEAAGIILGQWVDCECDLDPENEEKCLNRTRPLKTILAEHTAHWGIPVLYNFPFGHGDQLCSFPVGIRAKMDTRSASVVLLEDALT